MLEPLTGAETTRRLIDQQVSTTAEEVHTMKTMNWNADNAQKSESETIENKATYRAPRLVALGTAVDIVQYGSMGRVFDSNFGNGRTWA
jgi:hypothetical protein